MAYSSEGVDIVEHAPRSLVLQLTDNSLIAGWVARITVRTSAMKRNDEQPGRLQELEAPSFQRPIGLCIQRALFIARSTITRLWVLGSEKNHVAKSILSHPLEFEASAGNCRLTNGRHAG